MLKLFLLIITVCAAYAAQSRIINGTVVAPESDTWKFVVSYQYESEHNCGGSLIAPTWVLSAAHCWIDPLTEKDTIAVGSYALDQQHHHAIKRVIVHPDYDAYTNDNDILLFELVEPVTSILPVLLDHSLSLQPNVSSWVAGWGVTISGSQQVEPDLLEVLVPLVDSVVCNIPYRNAITENMLCAGYMEGGKDSCQGDSGGPLISKYYGQVVQIGIVSWGEGCALEGYPGVYTKVQNYIPWIEGYTGTLPAPKIPVNSAVMMYLLHSSSL